MADRDMVIKSIENCLHNKDCEDCCYEGCIHAHGNCIGDLMAHALELLRELPEQKHEQAVVLRCKDCGYWIPGTIDEHDNFIPPRCKINNGPWSASEHCSRAIRR